MLWKPFPLNLLLPESRLDYTPNQVGIQVQGEQDDGDGVEDDNEAVKYDYIVVGSGTAGAVIASRLSERKKEARILVLEAGQRVNDLISTIPLFSILRSNDAKYSYKIKTVEQSGLGGKDVEVLAGRLVGGSSAINAGIYTRGTDRELDEWETVYGCQGWNHSSLQRCFQLPIRHDTKTSLLCSTEENEEPTRGPWEYSLRRDHLYPVTEKVLSVLDAKGVRRNDSDPYSTEAGRGPIGSGSFILQSSMSKNGRKVHAGNAYLSDKILRERKSMKLCTGAKVTKIHLEKKADDSVVAKGVYFEDSRRFYAHATSKVILCAGVLHTPHLLLLSGVGPEAELSKHLIRPVLLSPDVGQNLKDHLGVPLHFLVPYSSSSICVSDGLYALPQFLRNLYDYFARNGAGVLSSPGFMEASAWLNTDDLRFSSTEKKIDGHDHNLPSASSFKLQCSDPRSSICNIELLFSTYWLEWAQTRFKGLDELENPSHSPRGIMGIYVILTRPKSKGSVTLQSSDPHDAPLIDFNYLQDRHDLQTIRQGVKFALDVAKSLFEEADFDISPADVPGWDNKQGKYAIDGIRLQGPSPFAEADQIPDDAYDEFIRSRANPIYHGSSSCRMGPPGTPVDPISMRIRGTSNLHVFDASVFPNVPSTHPQSLVFAGAEKVAEQL
ncbi:hypothetical protein CBS101457_001963 [Exobasidium rhododendri]|nr:hypothetical protein CBS101457_001963 [Exobasidium rhododendri]